MQNNKVHGEHARYVTSLVAILNNPKNKISNNNVFELL